MAVVATKELQARIESGLQRSREAWLELSELASEWPEWDEGSKLDFDIDWPIQEDLLAQLADWHARGLMSAEQERRYQELLEIVSRQRPVLERLLASLPAK